jgi:FkbM family methyltransferase
MTGQQESAARALEGLLYMGYALLRVVLKLLIGSRRRSYVMNVLGLHYSRVHTILLKKISNKYATMYGGVYEPHFRRIIKKALEKGCTFIDAGAYKGLYTFYAHKVLRKKQDFKIIAVEPFPNNYRILKNKINNENIHLVKEAIWTRDNEIVKLYVENISSDGSSLFGRISLTRRHAIEVGHDASTLLVQTVRLDTLIKRFRLECVDLIKMDIEGAEYEVLTDPTLSLSNVKNIIVEVHYKKGSAEFLKIIEALSRHGFKIAPLYLHPTSNRHHLLAFRDKIPW